MLAEITIIPEKLRIARGEMSQTEAAKLVGIYKQRLYAYETGKDNCPADVLARLCQLYGKPIEFFTTR